MKKDYIIKVLIGTVIYVIVFCIITFLLKGKIELIDALAAIFSGLTTVFALYFISSSNKRKL